MKLCVRQKTFTWGDKFTVFDEYGHPRYYVEGEVFTLGKKLHVYDADGNEVAFIERKLFTWMPRYVITAGGNAIAEVVREFSFASQKYAVDGPGWRVEGDFFAHSYTITENGRLVATIEKEWFTWGDVYSVEYGDGREEVIVLAVVLSIDAAMAESQSSS
jgi:uncharacterized protein YxjI